MASNTQWTTCGRKLLLNGKSFFIRGVNYAPTPIGLPGRLDMLGHEEIFMRDLVNLRDMHANAVKTYDFNPEIDHSKYLDAAYNGGEKPIYSIFSIWIDQTLMEPVVDIDSPEFQAVVQGYYDMAKTTGNHPGVMGYSIGGEMNSIVVVNDKAFWEKFALLTQAVRRGLKENSGAQKIITTTFVDDGGMSFTAGERYKADVDMWGSNVYQTNYPGSVIPTYMRVPGGKPMLVSEYGYPYASNIAEGTEEELHTVGKLLIKQTVAMEANFNLTDSLKEQVLVGGFVFEYSDEWWKSGAENVHNLGGVMNRNFPMGWLSEEFFGLYRAVKSEEDNEHALDEMQARPTVDLIKAVWSKGSIAGEGDDYSSCAVSHGSTANLQLRHPLESPSPTGAVGSFIEGMFAVVALCALALLAFAVYDTKMRRSRYRRLSPVLKPEEGSQSAHTRPSLHQSVAASRRYSQVVDGDENEAVV